MPEYEVILTPDAQYDLDELENYIATKLHAPDVAEQYIDDILDDIFALNTHAKHFRLVDDEPWHSRGQRRMNARNFAVLYILIEEEETVFVQNVIYQKRDIPQVLKERYGILD